MRCPVSYIVPSDVWKTLLLPCELARISWLSPMTFDTPMHDSPLKMLTLTDPLDCAFSPMRTLPLACQQLRFALADPMTHFFSASIAPFLPNGRRTLLYLSPSFSLTFVCSRALASSPSLVDAQHKTLPIGMNIFANTISDVPS